jgi:hypothetical protein
MLVQIGVPLPIPIFFPIRDPLPHEPLQPVPHGGHDEGFVKKEMFYQFISIHVDCFISLFSHTNS